MPIGQRIGHTPLKIIAQIAVLAFGFMMSEATQSACAATWVQWRNVFEENSTRIEKIIADPDILLASYARILSNSHVHEGECSKSLGQRDTNDKLIKAGILLTISYENFSKPCGRLQSIVSIMNFEQLSALEFDQLLARITSLSGKPEVKILVDPNDTQYRFFPFAGSAIILTNNALKSTSSFSLYYFRRKISSRNGTGMID